MKLAVLIWLKGCDRTGTPVSHFVLMRFHHALGHSVNTSPMNPMARTHQMPTSKAAVMSLLLRDIMGTDRTSPSLFAERLVLLGPIMETLVPPVPGVLILVRTRTDKHLGGQLGRSSTNLGPCPSGPVKMYQRPF